MGSLPFSRNREPPLWPPADSPAIHQRFLTFTVMRAIFGVLAAILVVSAAHAGELSVVLKTAKGQPVRDAVVTVYPAAGVGSAPFKFDWPYRMAQDHLQFDP